MNICFLARPAYDKVSTRVYKCLVEKFDPDTKGVFVTLDETETDFVKSQIPDAVVYEISGFNKAHWAEYDESKLVEIEKKYDCAPIWSYIYTDRFLIDRDYDYAVKTTVGLFMFFEEIFSKQKIDFYYSEAIATLVCYVAYIVGKKYGVKYVSQMGARGLDSTHHYFIDDPFQSNSKMVKDYSDIEYSAEEIARADSFLKEFEEHDIRPSYMIKNGAVPRLHLKYLKLPIKRFIKSFNKKYTNPYSYIYYQSHKRITDPIKFYFRYQKAKKYYHQADYSKKYIYYPLHYQPEASTIVCAAKYEKQLYFIDSWAKSIPADTVLYVKEHYAILGHRDLQFYKELRHYPNVVLIDPYESPRKLIEKAYAVTTLTGTAGWEAMLLRKPVFIGGNIFFDNAPGVVKVKDIYQNYVDKIDNWQRPERNDVVNYLCAYFRSLREGSIPKIYRDNSQDDVYNITRSLYEYLKGL